MALNGSSVLLKVQTSSGPNVYTVIGSQTGVKFTEKNQAIDVSTKAQPQKQYIYGEYEASITLDHLYVPNDTGYAALKAANRNQTTIVVERNESGSDLEYATALVTQLDADAKKAAPTTLSVTLQITGVWTAGSAP